LDGNLQKVCKGLVKMTKLGDSVPWGMATIRSFYCNRV
jgi:hypothetical protein